MPQKIHKSDRLLDLAYPEDLPREIDFLNLEKRPWFYPRKGAGEDFRSFPEIYEEALNAALETLGPVIGKYMAQGRFPIKEAAQAIGNGGLSIRDEAGRPCAPSLSDPLPLAEILEGQRELRSRSFN